MKHVLQPTILRSIPWVIFGVVLMPAVATIAVGIVILSLGGLPLSGSIAVGVLTICMAVFMITGATITLALLRRQNKLTQLQTEFVTNASQELRSPLAGIRMYVDTLRLGRVRSDQERESCYAALARETERLSALVEQLLDFRGQRSAVTAERKRELVGAEQALLQATAPFEQRPDQGDRLKVTLPEDLPALRLDRKGFDEALGNLIANAFNHGASDGLVTVSAEVSAGYLTIAVSDDGPGVPERERARVFDRFYRTTTSTDSGRPGLGLGLAIVKTFVDSHGGRLAVDDAPGGGARFSMWLPVSDEPVPTPPSAPETPADPDDPPEADREA